MASKSSEGLASFRRDRHFRMAQCPRKSCRKFGVSVSAYCLMPNRVRLVLAPSDPAGLALPRGRRLFAGYFNARARQTGHLFQGRFGSLAMDEDHLIAAVRYAALNPARARGCKGLGMAAFQPARAHGRRGRRLGQRPALARPCRQFRGSARHRPGRSRVQPVTAKRIDRSGYRFARLSRRRQPPTQSRRDALQARAKAEGGEAVKWE